MRDSEKTNKRKKTIKTLRIVFTIVVTAAVLTVFVGVWRHKKNSKDPNELTDNNTNQSSEEVKTVTDVDSSISIAESLLTEKENEDGSKTEGDTASTLGETDPLKFSKEQILVYLNNAGNKVRNQKPGFTYIEKSTASNLNVNDSHAKILATAAEKIIGFFLKDYKITVKKGEKSAPIEDYALTSYFGSEQETWALNLKPEDVKYAKITKEGNNYRVNVSLINENNPQKDGKSAYGRGMLILTIEDILRIAHDEGDSIFGGKMLLEMKDKNGANLYYHDGKISALIDPNGNIIEMDSKFLIDACGKNFSLKIGNPKAPIISYSCKQFDVTIGKEYIQKDFKW